MLKVITSSPPLLVYHDTQYKLHFVVRLLIRYLVFDCLILRWVRLGTSSSTGTYTRPPVMVAYSAAGLISASSLYLSAHSQYGQMIQIMACSTSFLNVSTLRLVGGHYVIRVKVIFIIASYAACSKTASFATDVMVSSFGEGDDSVFR